MSKEYVYFIRHKGLIKIGYSADIDSRLSVMRAMYSKCEILGIIEGDKKKESALHAQFISYRCIHRSGIPYRTDWFNDNEELLTFIRTHASDAAPIVKALKEEKRKRHSRW